MRRLPHRSGATACALAVALTGTRATASGAVHLSATRLRWAIP